MFKSVLVRLKQSVFGAAAGLAVALALLAPAPANAWWGPGWGWHAGWGWRGGVYVGVPSVVVVAPVYPPAPYPYPYAAPYHWIPAHYTPWGAFVPGHWGY
jgi:hypothetical protein